MKEQYGKIEYKGKEYLLAFNINVMEEIQAEYGSTSKWSDLAYGTDEAEPDAKALKFGFREMLNEGIDINNEENGTDMPPFTLKQVGRLLTEIGFKTAAQAVMDTVTTSTEPGEAEKNA